MLGVFLSGIIEDQNQLKISNLCFPIKTKPRQVRMSLSTPSMRIY